MKLGRTPWAVLAAIVAIAIGWFVTRPGDPPDSPGGGGTAVVEQPSGKVIEHSGIDDAVSATAPRRPDAPEVAAGATPSADTEPDATVAWAPAGDSVAAPADAPADPPSVPVVVEAAPATGNAADDRPAGDARAQDAEASGSDGTAPAVAADTGMKPEDTADARDVAVSDTAGDSAGASGATAPDTATTVTSEAATGDGTAATGHATGEPKRIAAIAQPPADDAAAEAGRSEQADADKPPQDKAGVPDEKPADTPPGDTSEADDARIAAAPPTDQTRPTAADADRAAVASGSVPDDPDAPSLDLVRIEPDGHAVLAGRAAPDTPVDILIDGKVIETVRTDAAGNFVAILQTPATGAAQNLQLRVPDPDATEAPLTVNDEEPVLRAPDATLTGSAVRDKSGIEAGTETDATIARAPQSDPVEAPAAPEVTAPAAPERAPEGDAPDTTAEAAPTAAEPAEPTPQTPGELAAVSAPTAPDGVRTGGTDRPVDGARTGPAPAEGADDPAAPDRSPAVPGQVADRGFLTSAPVIILPGSTPDDAPTVLSTTREDLKIVQPSVTNINSVVLDRISYGETGDVLLQGRGRAGKAVRIYGNGLVVGTTRVASDGTWTMSVAQALGQEIKLLRMDEIDRDGRVVTRIEAPFTYSRFEPKLVRQREVVIQKGDMLWRIAEQYYGQGLRYSVIYGANSKLIRDPDLIYPGQVFTVPELIDADK